jgi:hypothetical protein
MCFENAEQHFHLGSKVEKGPSWEALGTFWAGLGRPSGAKSSPELTF